MHSLLRPSGTMNALFQVSRLTRPQRIRCRPRLLLAPGPLCTRYIGTTASWIAPSVDDATSIKPRYRGGSPSTRADRSVGSEMSVQQRKGDRLDWEVAVEMAEARKLKDAAEGISSAFSLRCEWCMEQGKGGIVNRADTCSTYQKA